jgi:hypothetical protein
MPRNVLNLELSSGAFSAAAFEGVAARELSPELRVEAGAEADWAFSGARSAMAAGQVCLGQEEWYRVATRDRSRIVERERGCRWVLVLRRCAFPMLLVLARARGGTD